MFTTGFILLKHNYKTLRKSQGNEGRIYPPGFEVIPYFMMLYKFK